MLALGAVLLWLAYLLGTVTASVIVALIVAAAFAPLGRRLRARGWSSTASAAAVTGAAVVVGGGLIALVVLAFIPYLPDIVEALESGVDRLSAQFGTDQVAQISAQLQAWLQANLAELVGSVANAVTVALLALFLTFFLLQDGEQGWDRTVGLTGGGWRRERLDEAGHVALDRVGGYLRGTAILSAVVAATDLVYMILLGVPLAAPLAVLVFLAGFIPYVGGLIATLSVLIVAGSLVSIQTALILFALIAVTRVVVSNVLRPMVYGRNVGLHPAIILLVLPAGAALAGAFGVFVAVPVAVFFASLTGSVIAALDPPTEAERAKDVAPWLDRVAQWAWRLLIVVAVGIAAAGVVGLMPLVTVPLLLAIILAATVGPLDRALRRRGWGRTRAAALVTGGSYVAVLAIMVVAVAALGPPLADAIAAGSTGAEGAADSTNGALSVLESVTAELGTNVLSFVGGILGAVGALSIVLLLGGLLTFYLLRDGERGWRSVTERVDMRHRGELETTIREGSAVLGGYMGGTAVISLVGAVSQAAIMAILGLPFVLPVAVLSFFACFIPYVGGFVSTGLAFLIAVAYGDATTVLIMGIYTIVFNIVQGNIVTPLVYRRAVHLHPAVILLAIPAGGAIGGIAGMFLAVPILALVETARRPIMRVLDDEREANEDLEPPLADRAPRPDASSGPQPATEAPAG